MNTIEKTTDYSIFEKHKSNREIDNLNLKRIIFSLESQNMLEFRPILVDEDMRVIDGQHRLEAAKHLGLPIYYQITHEEQTEDIILLNANQKPWVMDDYINYYISKGKLAFQKFRDFQTAYNLTTGFLLRMLKSTRDRAHHEIKIGTFVFYTQSEEEALGEALENSQLIVDTMKRYILIDKAFLHSVRFKISLLSFVQQSDVVLSIFLNKIKFKAEAIRPCASADIYYQMFLDIYNFRNQNPI